MKVITQNPTFKVNLQKLLDTYGLQGSWEGGNDSGSCSINLDSEPEPLNEEELATIINYLENKIETLLDYGSWAGNFSSSGHIVYDPIEKAIILEGSETNEEGEEIYENQLIIELKKIIPPKYRNIIDSVNLYVDNSSAFNLTDGEVRVRLNIINGPWLPEYTTYENDIEKSITTFIKDYFYEDGFRCYVDQSFSTTSSIRIPIHKIVDKDIFHTIKIMDNELELELGKNYFYE